MSVFREKSDDFSQKRIFVTKNWEFSAILSDIFPIPSLAIYFSSHAILKMSDKITQTSR